MADLIARPPKYLFIPGPREKDALIAVKDFNEGLFTDQDPFRVPDNALVQATNVVYARGQPLRRNGLTDYSITKPNSNKILKMFAFYSDDAGITVLRFTPSTVYRAGSAGWTAITPSAIAAFSGSVDDRFWLTVGDNRCFVSNNGIDPIREIVPVSSIYQAVGNAPRYRYITTAFNRLIGANFYNPGGTSVPFQLGWSGDLNYTEWDTTVDPSAGSTELVDSPSDTNDDITGLFSYANLLIVPRIRTMWIGVGQPSATAPFVFYSAVPTVGCDVPYSQQLTNYGLVWLNYQEQAIYLWKPATGSQNEPISIAHPKVARAIKQDITDPNLVWSSYSSDRRTYSLFIANSGSSTVIEWSFNFDYQVWTKSEFGNDVSSVDDLDFSASTGSIDELTGIIDDLVGTIDELGGLVSASTRFFGYLNGDLRYQKDYFGATVESANIVSTDAGTSYTTTIGVKGLESPVDYLFQHLVRATLVPRATGTVNLQYSKDDGQNWTTAKSVTFVSGDLNKAYDLQLRKAFRAKRIMWRITTSDCMCSLIGFFVEGIKGGLSK